MGESILRDRRNPLKSVFFGGTAYRKGIGLIFPNQEVDDKWQHKRSWGRCGSSWEEFSFLFNRLLDPGIGLPEIR
jgi:hypothetical protein